MKLTRWLALGLMGTSLLFSSLTYAASNAPRNADGDDVEIVKTKEQEANWIEWIKKELKRDHEAERILKDEIKERKREYNDNKALYGERYTLSVKIAQAATKLMEEHRSPEAYVEGANYLIQLVSNQDDISTLRGLASDSEKVAKNYARKYKKYGELFSQDSVKEVEKKVKKLLKSRPTLSGKLRKYLLGALNRPFMDCTRTGGGFLYGAVIIGGGSLHVVSCKSFYGRHVPYTFSTAKIGLGLAFAGHGKGVKVEKTREDEITVESFELPYSFFSKNKFHFAGALSVALGLGVNMERENLKENFGTKNGVMGGFVAGVTGGLGYIKKWGEQTPDFKEFFEKIGMRF